MYTGSGAGLSRNGEATLGAFQVRILIVFAVAVVLFAEPPHYLAARHGGPYMHNYY